MNDARLRKPNLKEALAAEAKLLAELGRPLLSRDLLDAIDCMPVASWERIERDLRG